LYSLPKIGKLDYIEGKTRAIQLGIKGYISLEGVSKISSSEQKLNGKILEDILEPNGVILIRLGDNFELTDEVFNSRFESFPSDRVLSSDAFDPCKKRVHSLFISRGISIFLRDYVMKSKFFKSI